MYFPAKAGLVVKAKEQFISDTHKNPFSFLLFYVHVPLSVLNHKKAISFHMLVFFRLNSLRDQLYTRGF